MRNNDSNENLNISDYEKNYKELEKIFDYIPVLIFYKDTKNNYIKVNKYVADAHNMRKDELEHINLFDLYPKKQAQAYWDDDLKIIESKQPKLNYIEKWNTKDGKRWVRSSKIPFKNDHGEIIGIIGVSIDITDLKQIEHKLRKSTSNTYQILENLPIGIMIVDLNRKIKDINREALKMIGFSQKSELIDQNCFDFVCPNIERCPIIHDRKIIDNSEKRILNKNGKSIPILKSVMNVTIDDEDVLLEAFVDISQLKKVEEKLRESEHRFRYILENSQNIIYRYNFKSSKYDYVSSSVSEILGFNPKEMIKMGIKGGSKYVHPNDRIMMASHFQNLKKPEDSNEIKSSIEFRFKHPLKEYRWMHDNRTVLFNDTGDPISMVGNIVDITKEKHAQRLEENFRKELEHEVVKRTEQLNRSLEIQQQYLDNMAKMSRFKNDFFSSVSHELRTPLNAINGFAEILREGIAGSLNEKQKEILSDLLRSSDHLLGLINEILDLSNINEIGEKMKLERISIEEITQLIILNLQHSIQGKNVSYEIDLNNNYLNQEIFVDKQKLDSILKSIIGHCISRIESGNLIYEIKDDNDFWIFILKIKNLVYDEKEIENLFLDFSPEKSLSQNNLFLTGLKLPIAKQLVEIHGGKIWVESKLDNFTRYFFSIPKINS